MKAIFLDVTGLTPEELERSVNVAKKILLKDDENIVIVSVGYGGFSTWNRWKLCDELCLKRFEVSKYLDMDKGVEILEWINHHVNIDHLCIVTNEEEVHPLDIFRVPYSRFFLKHRIKKMLKKPFKPGSLLSFKNNLRKMF